MNDSLKELASSLLLQNQADNGGQTEGLEGPKYQIPLDDFFTLAVSVDCVVFGFDGGSGGCSAHHGSGGAGGDDAA